MRHLYDREIEFRGEIERLKDRLVYRWLRRAGAVVAPVGSARTARPDAGLISSLP